jgi:Icc-related predicted phosphoesterase
MKIRPLSDLHLEYASINLTPSEEDMIIFAGDIGIHTTGMQVANKVSRNFDVPVLYVAGNHEYYRTPSMDLVSHTWEGTPTDIGREADHTSKIVKGETTYFENTCCVYDGVRFIGGTLWTDMEYFGKNYIIEYKVKQAMNDYRAIWSQYNHPLTIEMVIERHQETLAFFRKMLSEKFDGPTVVISHHTPSSLSVASEYKTDEITAGYTSRLEEFILDFKPELWIHGHTHHRYDYILGETRVVCNPRGYIPYEDTGFDPNLIVEI